MAKKIQSSSGARKSVKRSSANRSALSKAGPPPGPDRRRPKLRPSPRRQAESPTGSVSSRSQELLQRFRDARRPMSRPSAAVRSRGATGRRPCSPCAKRKQTASMARSVASQRANSPSRGLSLGAGVSRGQFLRTAGFGAAALGATALGLSGAARATMPQPSPCAPVTDPGFKIPLYRTGVLCGNETLCATTPFAAMVPNLPTDPGAYNDMTLQYIYHNVLSQIPVGHPLIPTLLEFAKGFGLGVLCPHQTENVATAPITGMPASFGPQFAALDPRMFRLEFEVEETPFTKFFKLFMAGLQPLGPDLYIYNTAVTGLQENVHFEYFDMRPYIFGLDPSQWPPLPPLPPNIKPYPLWMPIPITTPGIIDQLFAAVGFPEGIKLRGYYIQGDGFVNDATDEHVHPLLVFTPGVTRSIVDPESIGIAFNAVSQGYSVFMFDKRGHGFSDDPNGTVGEDVFIGLEALESGAALTLGPGETEPVQNRPLLQDVMDIPIVLAGISQGAGVMSKAMALNYNVQDPNYGIWLPIDTYYNADGSLVPFGQPPKGYNIRGLVEMIGYSGSPYFHSAPPLFGIEAAGVGIYSGTPLGNGNIYNTMPAWPGCYMLKMTEDLGSPVGSVENFGRMRGFKKVELFEGYHGELLSGSNFSYVVDKMLKWMDHVVLNDPPMDNMAKTTLDKEVCQARKSEGRLDASELRLTNIIKNWLKALMRMYP